MFVLLASQYGISSVVPFGAPKTKNNSSSLFSCPCDESSHKSLLVTKAYSELVWSRAISSNFI